jgi:hypothetical protein
MSRKTKQQKIIADLRRQLVSEPTPIKQNLTKLKEATVSLPAEPSLVATPAKATIKTVDTTHLKNDLIKVSSLVSAAVILEIIFSFFVTHGYLARWGIS